MFPIFLSYNSYFFIIFSLFLLSNILHYSISNFNLIIYSSI